MARNAVGGMHCGRAGRRRSEFRSEVLLALPGDLCAIAKVDAWYAKNPGRMQQTVVETIWFELVAPGLKQSK